MKRSAFGLLLAALICALPVAAAETATTPVFDLESGTVLLNSGYTMPIMGLGTYSLSDEECYASVTALLEAGGRLIDTAYMYHNEAAVGRAVRDSGVPREEVFVITKLYPTQFADADAAIDAALEKLDIGYIDLMLLHHPGAGDVEAYKAMERAVVAGKIRSIGLSNWYVEELEAFLPQVDTVPALVQNEIHPYYQEQDVVPYIQSPVSYTHLDVYKRQVPYIAHFGSSKDGKAVRPLLDEVVSVDDGDVYTCLLYTSRCV